MIRLILLNIYFKFVPIQSNLIIIVLEKYMLPCLSKYFMEIDCPGCGFQRSLFALLKGDFAYSFKIFPAIFTTLLFFAISIFFIATRKQVVLKYLIIVAIVNALVTLIAYIIKLNLIFNH